MDGIDKAPLSFRQDFIRTNKIKMIKGRISTKKPMAAIRTTNLYQAYFFDEQGRIESSYETMSAGDTLWRTYFYNDKGHLIYQSEEQNEVLRYTTYLRDESLRVVVKEDFERKADYMGIPTTISVKKEKYEYIQTDSSEIKWVMNETGTRVYKQETFFSPEKLPIRQEERFASTNEGTITTFEYDKNKRLIATNTLTSKQKLSKESCRLKYDKWGNPMEKQQFEKGSLIFETQYLVNETSGMLTAVINQKGELGDLKIIRFQSFEFYD